MSIPKLIRGTCVLVLVVAAALAAWGFWLEPSSLRVVQYPVGLAHCPAPLAGMRVAVISDLHAGTPYVDAAKLHRVADLTNDQHPDLILIAGDIFVQKTFGGHDIAPQVVADELARLHAPLGVYAVLGNHDYYDGHEAEYRQYLKGAGIPSLDNAVQRVAVGDLHIWIAGFGDVEMGRPDVPGTLAQITDDAPVIALTHDPVLLWAVPATVNLVVAGHTHGGQVRFSRLSKWALRRRFDLPYLNGHYRRQTDLFVTTGIGTTGIPVRFRVPPEIAILTLSPDSEASE